MTNLSNTVRDPDAPICEKGVYPYPDDCVRVVIGLRNDAATRDTSMAAILRTFVAVSPRKDRVEEAFDRIYPGFRWMLTLSLDELREHVMALRVHRDEWRQRLGLFRLLFPFAQPYLVAHNVRLDEITLDTVYAGSIGGARKLVRHPIRARMAVDLKHLEKTLAKMERVRMGEEKAPYLWDYRP